MKAFHARVRVLAAALALLLLGLGVGVATSSRSLPYGNYWYWGLAVTCLAAALPVRVFLAHWGLSRRLFGARLFRMPAREIPRKPDETYLGEGFAWDGRATGLLGELSREGLELPQAVQDRMAGDWRIHGLGGRKLGPLFLPDALLNQHLFLMGAPGSGKTRGLELLIDQAIRRGDALVVIDPKGDEGLLDRAYDSAVRHGRAGDFRVIALPYPYQSARYNPLADYVVPSDVADRVAATLPRSGGSEAFRNFAWEFVNTVATALDILGDEVSLVKIENYTLHNTWLLVRRLMRHFCPSIRQVPNLETTREAYLAYCEATGRSFPELDAVIHLADMNREYFGKISGSLRTVLAKLTSRSVGYILSPADVPAPPGVARRGGAPVVSWRSIENDRLIVYFYLGSLIGPDTANATARMALSDLMSHVGKKYAYDDAAQFGKRRLTVVVDEVADAIAPESINILNKARGAGLSMVMAGQSLADLEVALGSSADARRALANVGTFLTLRAANPDDAAYFSDKVGTRPLPVVTRGESYEPALFSSGNRQVSDFAYRSSVSTSTREEPLLPTSTLDRLPRFHYFGLWAGGLYKGVLPLLDRPEYLFSPSLKYGPLSAEPAPSLAVPAAAESPRPGPHRGGPPGGAAP